MELINKIIKLGKISRIEITLKQNDNDNEKIKKSSGRPAKTKNKRNKYLLTYNNIEYKCKSYAEISDIINYSISTVNNIVLEKTKIDNITIKKI